MEFMESYINALISLTIDMAPYLLLGFLFAGILKVIVPPDIMSRYLGKSNTSSVVNASLFGVPLPLCSCGVLPAGISLYKNGASKGSSVSFLISTPQTGIDSILVTWSMLGLPMAVLRPVVAFMTGVFGGILTNKLEKSQTHAKEIQKVEIRPKKSLKEIFSYAFIEMVDDIAKWLVIGLLIAALITVMVPDNFFHEFHLTGITGMLLILIVSIPLYIFATASVTIAAVLLLKGLSPGAILVFLMAGPATNAATMTVIGKNLGKKTLAIYMSSLIVGSLLFGLLIDYFLPGSWFLPLVGMGEHSHEILPEWLSYGSSIVLAAAILLSFGKKVVQQIKIRTNKTFIKNTDKMSNLMLNVEGMSCPKCKAKVELGLMTIPGISMVVADNENNTVEIEGVNLDNTIIQSKISDLGYDYMGVIED